MKFLAKSVYGSPGGLSHRRSNDRRAVETDGKKDLYKDESTNERIGYNMEKGETAVNHEEEGERPEVERRK